MKLLLIKYVIFAAMRDKLILSLIVASLVTVSLSLFLGSSAVIEQDQFTVVYIASSLRILFIFSLVSFIVFFIRRSFEDKEIEYLLSRPISRKSFVISYCASFIALSMLFATIAILILSFVGYEYWNGNYLLWGYSFFVEMAITALAAFFFSMILSSPVSSIIVTAAFYVLARLIGGLLGISSDNYDGTSFEIMSNVMQTISLFVPRFDLLTQSSWLLSEERGGDINLVLITLQGAIFSSVLIVASMVDLVKRQF